MAVGDPTGEDLCVGTTNGNTLPSYPSSPEEREITLGAGYALTSGVKYAIVIRAISGNGSNKARLMDESFNPYADGDSRQSTDSGSTWTIPTRSGQTIDCWFKTKANGVVKDSHTFTVNINNVRTIYANLWQTMTFTTTSSYTITSVILSLSKIGSPGTITVSIKATVPATPTKATNPTPSDAASDVTLDQATVTWEDGGGATFYDVYYGTESGNLSKVSSSQAGVSFTINGITNGSPFEYLITRYWRIDSINVSGTTTGDEWSFITIRFTPPTKTYWYSTGGYYYKLLVQDDGTYGDPPPTGTEDTDYVVVTSTYNNMATTRRLVAAANDKIWYESI